LGRAGANFLAGHPHGRGLHPGGVPDGWILPLFPAQPKLAPIFNPVTHMVPPPFPLLLIFPALAMDLILRRAGERPVGGGGSGLLLGAIFLAVFIPVQWFFSKFILSPHANNWFLWATGSGITAVRTWRLDHSVLAREPKPTRLRCWPLLLKKRLAFASVGKVAEAAVSSDG
jgi:uncharacterized membrane protein